jgi:hypothetical protein
MSQAPPVADHRTKPVMTETQYDRASAGMMCVVVGLLGGTALLVAVWFTNRLPAPPEAVPIEILDMSGGFEDGNPDETPNLESPEEEIPDPSIAETSDDQSQIQEMLETVVELSDSASQQVEQAVQSESSSTSGKIGSATGTGGRPLGMGGGGNGGFPAEQRWFIKFDDGSLQTYAQQLDFFKIELGALFLQQRELVFLSNLAKPKPTERVVKTGGDNRLYMTWKGGSRKQADVALFKKSGRDAANATLMHFYSPETEQLLAQTEVNYRGRKTTEIRRTYFSVRKDGAGFKFVVTSQSYLR